MKNFVRMLSLVFILMMCIAPVQVMACEGCGYEDIDPYEDVLPPSDQLHMEAYLLGDAMIGRTLHVLRSGNIRTSPSLSAQIVTEAYPDDKLAILDYYMESVNPLSMWLKIDFYGMEGWINASRGKVVTCRADDYNPANEPELEAARSRYVGQTMMVNVGSGKARAGAGMDYPAIEYIHRYETYKIQNAEMDSEGKIWFMIRIGSRECWVRDTLFSYIGD